MKLPGRKKIILLTLMLFGPGLLLIILSRGQQKFNYLDTVATIENFKFYDLDSNLITLETNEKEIIIFTTIQSTCFDNKSKECTIYPFYIEELFYREYDKAPKKYDNVKIYSIVTDANGNAVSPDSLLIETFKKYDSNFWELVTGDPKQIYSFEKEGINFSTLKDDEGNLEFPKMAVLMNEKGEIKTIRPINGEAYAKDFNEKFRLLLKEKKIKEYNESK